MSHRMLWVILSQCWQVYLYAITCTGADFQPTLCNLPIMEGVRCANAEFFRSYCSEKTDGCGAVGGCFGFTPPGHWYPILGTDGKPFRRCRCGCFSEETQFWGLGNQTGRNLIEAKNERIFLYTRQNPVSVSFKRKSINGLMHAKDTHAIHLVTLDGHSIFVSDGHPVVTARETGELDAMKEAKNVVVGDFLLTHGNRPIQVSRVERVPYEKEMMNFNVVSSNPMHHIVVANDLQMGDLAWQEQLHSIDARMYHRQDLWVYLEGLKK